MGLKVKDLKRLKKKKVWCLNAPRVCDCNNGHCKFKPQNHDKQRT